MGVLWIFIGIFLLCFFIIALFSCLKMAKMADEDDEKWYEQMKAKEKKDITEE
jgi:hypothetical protein